MSYDPKTDWLFHPYEFKLKVALNYRNSGNRIDAALVERETAQQILFSRTDHCFLSYPT